MQTLLLLMLSQAPTISPPPRVPAVRAPYTWSDGQRSYKLWESLVLVAEPSPTAAGKKALLALGASLVVDRPTMRVWKVTDAAGARAAVAELRPVFHDSPAGMGRYRVPLAVVCDGERTVKPWLEVLEGSTGACLPDFWYLPVLK